MRLQLGGGWKLISVFEYIFAMMVQLVLFYWFANEITLEVTYN